MHIPENNDQEYNNNNVTVTSDKYTRGSWHQ